MRMHQLLCVGAFEYVDVYTLFSFSLGLLTFLSGKIKERGESVLTSLKPRFSAESIVYVT